MSKAKSKWINSMISALPKTGGKRPEVMLTKARLGWSSVVENNPSWSQSLKAKTGMYLNRGKETLKIIKMTKTGKTATVENFDGTQSKVRLVNGKWRAGGKDHQLSHFPVLV